MLFTICNYSNYFQTVLFQCGIITDFTHTFTVFIYGDSEMNWEIPLSAVGMKHYPVRIGYISLGIGGERFSYEYPYSYLDITESGQSSYIPKIENIDQYAEYDINGLGSSLNGRFYHKLTGDADTLFNAGYECARLINEVERETLDDHLAHDCPCTLEQLKQRLFQFALISEAPSSLKCYELTFPVTVGSEEHTPRCCYTSSGALETNYINAIGYNTYKRVGSDQRALYEVCCGQTYQESGASSVTLCKDYLNLFPVSTCSSHLPMQTCKLNIYNIIVYFGFLGSKILISSYILLIRQNPLRPISHEILILVSLCKYFYGVS